ncbi:MAG: DUF4405 domain-containing protein [Chthoniobacterales bacterium]
MKRGLLNLLIDLLAAIALLVMIATGYILRFPLPPTTNRTHELWGLSRHEWGTVHSWASIGLLGVLLLHVILHWEWILTTIRRRFASTNKAVSRQRFLAGIITLAVLVMAGGLFAWLTRLGVRELDTPLHPLRGRTDVMTLPAVILPTNLTVVRTVDFQRDVLPVFEASCIGCHGPKKKRANFRADRRENFFATANGTPLIVPGDAAKSRLIAIVSGEVKDMKSAEDHLLPPSEIELLKTWINAGADWPSKQPANQSTKNP